VKGKLWDLEDEKKLTSWFKSGTTDLRVLAFSFDGKYSENAVYQKLLDLGLLKEEEDRKKHSSSSSKLVLPAELPSVEMTLKTLETPGLDKCEVLRLRGIIARAKVYKELLADYMDYRGLEAELLDWREKYEVLAKKSPGVRSK
jgi:hypothetical protein